MDSLKVYEKACDTIDKLLRQGKTMIEIYVDYTNKLSAEYEKIGTSESSRKDRVLYGEIQGIVAVCLAVTAVEKAGYQKMKDKSLEFREKADND